MTRAPLRVALRADASPSIGGGHVMRCLTLADEWRRQGAECVFLCASGTKEVAPALARAGYVIVGGTLNGDADAAALRQIWPDGADIFICDHYRLAAPYQTAMRRAASIIAVIDDLADRVHDCDFLLDQSLGRSAADYDGRVPAAAVRLIGTRYALLRPEFAVARNRSIAARANRASVERIIVSMGLTDLGGITRRAVSAARAVAADAHIDVLIGAQASSLPALRQLVTDDPKLTLHVDSSHVCEVMSDADLAIGAAGSTSWERCCLGLPAVVVVLAENQRRIAATLDAAGAASAGELGDVERLLADLTADRDRRTVALCAAANCADGRGAARVVAALRRAPHASSSLTMRRAELPDCVDVWCWRNDAVTRAMFADTGLVPWPVHVRWFDEKLKSESSLLLIAEVDRDKIGTVRFDRTAEGDTETSINIAPLFRGSGLGTAALSEAIAAAGQWLGSSCLKARVRVTNAASLQLFRSLGFVEGADAAGFRMLRREPQLRVQA